MSAEQSIPLSRLVARLSPILLRVDEHLLGVHDMVSTFVVHDAAETGQVPGGALVLGLGIVTEADARALRRRSGPATAIVVRESLADDDGIRETLGTQTRILALRTEATWSQLISTLAVVFGLGQQTTESIALGDAETDLFALANSAAAIVGGPVTIEDLGFRILAFSADQADADYARAQSVLGHQVPDAYGDALHEQGYTRMIYQSPTPVYIPDIAPEIRPRVVMRLQAGGELLGSVWAVVDEPLSAARQEGLIEAANVIALTMLRIRMTQDSVNRFRTQRILSLLEGGSAATEAARTTGLPLNGLAVLALGVAEEAADTSEVELSRLVSALAMHLHSVRPQLPVALLGDVLFAVLPIAADAEPDRARRIAEDFLERAGGGRVLHIGVGSPVAARELPVSRGEAERALRVLRHRGSRVSSAATMDDVFIDSLLLRMSDLVDDAADEITGPLRVLAAYDREHGTELIETLKAWLDHFGDVATASESLVIHKNTFRYRLRRLSELAGIDLADAEQRFGLQLQLRLFRL